MMGAEPLEVPQQSTADQHQQSLITPSTFVEDGCWESSSSKHHHQPHSSVSSVNGTQSHQSHGTPNQSQSQSQQGSAKGARRTRHRVDAGEPRGCFSAVSHPGFGFQPRNIFTSPKSGPLPLVAGSNVPNPQNPSLSPFHHPQFPHHQISPHFLHHHNHSPVGNSFPFPSGRGIPNPAEDVSASYYFQPMKMLSEYISSQQAQAASAAVAAMNNASPPHGQNGLQQQLLLREMLSKTSNRNNNNNNTNNNNNVTKCGYEEDVVVMEQDVNNKPEVEAEKRDSRPGSRSNSGPDHNEFPDSEDDRDREEDKDAGRNTSSNSTKPLKLELMENGSNKVQALQNGHGNSVETGSGSGGSSSSVTSATGGMRINGCRKRKHFQPQQRSDFEEQEDEEELDDEDYDSNVIAGAAAFVNSNKRLKESSGSRSASGSPHVQVSALQLAQEQDEDEEEEMQRMMMKADNNEYEDEQFEDDDDLATSERSERTTPNVNPKENSTNAPLTRQLLTDRSSNKDSGKASPSLSLLRSSASPKIMGNGLVGPNMRRREHNILVDLPFGGGVGPNPAAYFYQWKENFKSTLITHINELVETQFSLLFPGGNGQHQTGGNHPGRNVNGPNTSAMNANPASQGPRDSPREKVDKIPLQQKNPASLLLNGGTMCNNSNRERDFSSPPPEKMARLDRNSNKEFFPARFPFQVAGNIQRERECGVSMNANSHGGTSGGKLTLGQLHHQQQQQQQNFSSALMGLSQAAQMQHHQAVAAAAAAALNADMFENDAPISLVVNRDQLTPRKRRHKVTDTRLTPRAVSRLLGQVDTYGGGDLSPQRGEGRTPPPLQTPTDHRQGSMGPSLQTSVAIPNPSLSDSARLFTPYAHPLFGHHPPGANHHRLGSSPPMGIHPALLANPAEYVQQLRAEMNEARNGELSLLRDREGRTDHVRAVRDSGSLLSDRGGNGIRPSSVGSDSGETNSFGGDMPGSIYSLGASHSSSSTLTPMHLRKAKLMFFWVRYPSSSVIKMYFPDIKFNKNNTAQLVKWFSNFREFYYIQMEKYARQALSEGIKSADDLHITVDNELYRVLNLHYNRNNHIEVPSNFRYVVEQTLREFFKAIQQGKDQEQSWKKAIYKIIARLDDPVPDHFKSPSFLDQLE